MSDWKSIDSPHGHARWVDYDHQVEIRVRPLGSEQYEVSMLRAARYGPGSADEPPDVYAGVVRGLRAAARKVAWLKAHIERLLQGDVMARNRDLQPEPVGEAR